MWKENGGAFHPTPPNTSPFCEKIGSEIQSASLMYADGNCYLRICYLYLVAYWYFLNRFF